MRTEPKIDLSPSTAWNKIDFKFWEVGKDSDNIHNKYTHRDLPYIKCNHHKIIDDSTYNNLERKN